jgi:hypothetical protein
MPVSVWEAIFMLVVLKIPLIYVGVVVWWAVRAEPEVPEGGNDAPVLAPVTPCGWNDWKRRRPRELGRPQARALRRRAATRAYV